MSLAPPVFPSPIFLTDTENLKDIIQLQVTVLVCHFNTQLAIQLHQKLIQLVSSNREARKRPAESNSTPAMDLEFEDIRIRRYTNRRGIERKTHP